mmetsp:Transcript_24569/g.51119  ORF Transcript_24569/g.51119 Transcript_24569/m.51119 type:complete len:104 (+) Transcript_24569:1317-1628(+)
MPEHVVSQLSPPAPRRQSIAGGAVGADVVGLAEGGDVPRGQSEDVALQQQSLCEFVDVSPQVVVVGLLLYSQPPKEVIPGASAPPKHTKKSQVLLGKNDPNTL